jgi:hypothetical protein
MTDNYVYSPDQVPRTPLPLDVPAPTRIVIRPNDRGRPTPTTAPNPQVSTSDPWAAPASDARAVGAGQQPTYDFLDPYTPPGKPVTIAPAAAPSAVPSGQAQPTAGADQVYDFLDPYAAPKPPSKQFTALESAGKGIQAGLSFGTAPAIAGLAEASGEPEAELAPGSTGRNLMRPIKGAAKLLKEQFEADPLTGLVTGGREGPTTKAYRKGREAALGEQEQAYKQHPVMYIGGELGGGLVTPGFGAGKAATVGGRILAGTKAGAIGGTLTGAGTAISEGKSPGEVVASAVKSGAIGAPIGGTVGAVIGKRLAGAQTPGQRAAATAEGLGAPLPRGVASDSRALQATTGAVRSIPIVGPKIGQRVEATQEAAGGRIGDIAQGMAGGATSRAATDAALRPGLQNVIDANRTAIDAAYGGLRSQINETQRYTMPRTDAMLNRIMRERQAAGWPNPAIGLEQFRNVAGGATFSGAHRARVDAREAGNVLVPHPGYNKADYNKLTRAMTADLREMVGAAAKNSPQRAVKAFDDAEKEFGRLAEQNDLLHRLVNAKGEGAIATLLGAAKEKGGNVQLLAQLRNSMAPQDFQQIGGTLLGELGHNAATDKFSLAQFVTNWSKISAPAKAVLFSPQHQRDIDDIMQMGQHIKGALR